MIFSARLLHYTRLTHRYFGVLIAPSLLFFAFSGALQLFSFHETTQGSSYKPPAWAATLAQLHKKQTPVVPPKKPQPAGQSGPAAQGGHAVPGGTDAQAGHGGAHGDRGGTGAPAPQAEASTPPPSLTRLPHLSPKTLPLKFFFLLVSLGLLTESVTGIYMSYKYSRKPLLVSSLLVLGTALPIVLAWYASV